MTVLNANFPLRDQGVSNFVGLETLPRHRWYFVKEGFSPRLVENAIHSEGVGKAKLLVDPFSGGGTVALVGATEGLAVRAFEVNPFLRFLSAAKLRNASAETFKTLCSDVARAFSSPMESPLEDCSTFTEGNRWGRWLFPKEVLRTFEAGRQSIAPASTPERALAKLALIASAMNCCNASRDGKCLRYREDWQSHQATSSDFIASFNARAAMIAEDLSGNRVQGVDSAVTLGDARVLTGTMREKFDLCVTSPPYLNSFDYSDVYRPELFLGRFVSDTKQLQKVRLDAVRSHMQASWDDPKRDEFGSLYQECVKQIAAKREQLWDARIPKMIQAYFEDMETVLKNLRARAAEHASMWLVVSTSAYAGIEVPVDLILAEIGQRKGWFLREVGVLRYLRSSSQHVQHVTDETRKSVPLRESVVIFDATPKGKPKSKSRA
ncbi:MAG TPA: hypothetical protein VFB43_15105 [Terracidiphilus sp.]|nr:hypothetical protein [Terracidiphilus sp.]